MKKIWRVALYEFRRNVFKRSFLLFMFSVPLFIVVSIGLGLVMEALEDKEQPVGYVDHAGITGAGQAESEAVTRWLAEYDERLEFIAYSGEDNAGAAVQAGDIQVYFVLAPDYPETRVVDQYFIEKPGENAVRQFFDFLQINLLSSQDPDIAFRAAAGTAVTVRSVDGLRRVPPGGPTFGLLMPLLISIAFLTMILMSSGFTMNSVADEKENRTIEVLVTKLSTNRLIAGKIIGNVVIGLTLLLTWAVVILLGIWVARVLGVLFFQDLSMDWRIVLGTLAIAVPSYALVVALMTGIGAMVTTTQEGQSVSSIFFILHVIPLYISWMLVSDPHNSIGVILSVLPFTSLLAIGVRSLFTIVPPWQIWVSVMVQTVSAIGAIWLAGRSLRLGMLRYGQRLSLGRLLRPAK